MRKTTHQDNHAKRATTYGVLAIACAAMALLLTLWPDAAGAQDDFPMPDDKLYVAHGMALNSVSGVPMVNCAQAKKIHSAILERGLDYFAGDCPEQRLADRLEQMRAAILHCTRRNPWSKRVADARYSGPLPLGRDMLDSSEPWPVPGRRPDTEHLGPYQLAMSCGYVDHIRPEIVEVCLRAVESCTPIGTDEVALLAASLASERADLNFCRTQERNSQGNIAGEYGRQLDRWLTASRRIAATGPEGRAFFPPVRIRPPACPTIPPTNCAEQCPCPELPDECEPDPDPSPCPDGAVYCRGGEFFTPTEASPVLKGAFKTDPGRYRRVRLKVSVVFDAYNKGLNNLFWFVINGNPDMFGYCSLRDDRNRIVCRHDFDTKQRKKQKERPRFSPEAGVRYDVVYDWNGYDGRISFSISTGDMVVGSWTGTPNVSYVDIVSADTWRVELSFTGDNPGEQPTDGTYSDLSVEAWKADP